MRDLAFTIGHSNHTPDKFAGLLTQYGIETLVDVRSHPYSRHAPHFNARAMEATLSRIGIRRVFLGWQLGGRPAGGKFYDAKGRVDYALLSRSLAFREGISKLEAEIQVHTVALLCSEENPVRCHRRLLVGRALEERGFILRHIRGDGSIQTEGRMHDTQPVLFPETEENSRKSIRSASRKRPRPNSSER